MKLLITKIVVVTLPLHTLALLSDYLSMSMLPLDRVSPCTHGKMN